MFQKRAILRTDVLSTEYIRPYPQNHPETPFGGPFNAKPIIERALRKSQANSATKLKLYSYIAIGKSLGCVKIFPLGASGGRRDPNVNLGSP